MKMKSTHSQMSCVLVFARVLTQTHSFPRSFFLQLSSTARKAGIDFYVFIRFM